MPQLEGLRQQYRTLTVLCLALAAAPLVMLVVGFFIYRGESGSLAGSGRIDPLLLGVMGTVALLPLALVPVLRSVAPALPRRPDDTRSPGVRVMTLVVIEYAVWEVSSIVGLAAFILGAPAYLFLGAVIVTLQGYARSFPRWESFVARAEEMVGAAGPPLDLPIPKESE